MPINKIEIEKDAAQFREKWGYNSVRPIEIKSLLMDLDVLAVFKKMEESFSGMSVKFEDKNFMLVNSAHPIGRQNFTIFHEIYHLFVQKDFEEIQCREVVDPKEKKNESNANAFASNVLLPKDGLLKIIPKEELKKDTISIKTVLNIEQYFSCSHSALIVRLKQLNFISDKFDERNNTDIKLLAKQYGYSLTLYEPGNDNFVLGNYGVKAKKLFDDNIISKTHYVELMRVLGIDVEEDNLNG
jgi:Zn-dependent peptidase ImmA (M78 family)